jgi:hypothetical protein
MRRQLIIRKLSHLLPPSIRRLAHRTLDKSGVPGATSTMKYVNNFHLDAER